MRGGTRRFSVGVLAVVLSFWPAALATGAPAGPVVPRSGATLPGSGSGAGPPATGVPTPVTEPPVHPAPPPTSTLPHPPPTTTLPPQSGSTTIPTTAPTTVPAGGGSTGPGGTTGSGSGGSTGGGTAGTGAGTSGPTGTAPGAATPGTAPVAAHSNPWPWLLLVLLAAGAGVAVAVGSRRRRRGAARATPVSLTATPSAVPSPPVAPMPAAAVLAGADPETARIHSLLEVSRRLSGVTAATDIQRAVLREAVGLVPCRSAALVVRSGGLLLVGCQQDPRFLVPGRLGDGAIGRVAETGQPVVQVSASEPAIASLPAAFAAVPLVVDGSIAAVLVLIRENWEAFTVADRDLLMAMAPIAATVMQAAERTSTAMEESLRDQLTEVGNRRRFDSDLPTALEEAGDGPTALIMLDLDHFKSVNDRFGHPAGDALLRGVADVLRTTVRPHDGVYRYGGEEFVAVLPRTTGPEAVEIAERIRDGIAGSAFDIGATDPLRASASLGVAVSWGPTRASSAGDLVARADTALYAAKDGGRNRVCASGD